MRLLRTATGKIVRNPATKKLIAAVTGKACCCLPCDWPQDCAGAIDGGTLGGQQIWMPASIQVTLQGYSTCSCVESWVLNPAQPAGTFLATHSWTVAYQGVDLTYGYCYSGTFAAGTSGDMVRTLACGGIDETFNLDTFYVRVCFKHLSCDPPSTVVRTDVGLGYTSGGFLRVCNLMSGSATRRLRATMYVPNVTTTNKCSNVFFADPYAYPIWGGTVKVDQLC